MTTTIAPLNSSAVIGVVAGLNRSRLWDIQRDVDKLAQLMIDDDDLSCVTAAHTAITSAVLEMCKIVEKHLKESAGE